MTHAARARKSHHLYRPLRERASDLKQPAPPRFKRRSLSHPRRVIPSRRRLEPIDLLEDLRPPRAQPARDHRRDDLAIRVPPARFFQHEEELLSEQLKLDREQ